MSEYIFVSMVDSQPPPVGSEIGPDIPLHLTLLQWFKSDRSPEELQQMAEAALSETTALRTRATTEDKFGSAKDVPVIRAERTDALLNLHLNLAEAMIRAGAMVDIQWMGKSGHNPHVSHLNDQRLWPGDEILIDNVDLIVKEAKGQPKQIVGRTRLQDGSQLVDKT